MPERIEAKSGVQRVLLMPGSRRFEVERIVVPALQAVEQLRREGMNLVPVVLLAPTIERDFVLELLRETVNSSVTETIEWSNEDPLSVMASSHIGILKSGTCNLEAAVARLPFVCVYSGSWMAKVIVSLLIRLREFSPVNIIQSRTVPEIIQTTLSSRDIAQKVRQMVEASAYQKVIAKLERVSELLYDAPIGSLKSGFVCNVSQRVSEIVQDVIKEKSASH